MDKDRLNILSTLLVTVLLIAFAAWMVRYVPGTSADTLGTVIITAVVAKWLQQGAQQSAERQAEKVQEAVASVKNGSPKG
jgi:predicted MFS family arabinose efflux permease